MDKTKILLDCVCGCSFLAADYVFTEEERKDTTDPENEWIYIEHYVASFYTKQGVWDNLKSRLKMAWCAITGKEHRLYEVVLTRSQVKQLRDMLDGL